MTMRPQQPYTRLRLAILGDSPCGLCHANCCKQNGHEFAVLLEAEERAAFAPFSRSIQIRSGEHWVVEQVLPYIDGRCPFLGDDDLCRIYEKRPANCRRFQCNSGYHLGGTDLRRHSEFLERNADVREMLESL